jgi:hypothetical protein
VMCWLCEKLNDAFQIHLFVRTYSLRLISLFTAVANRSLQKRCAMCPLLNLFKLPSNLHALWPWKIPKCNTFVKYCWLFTRNWQDVFSLCYEHTAATKHIRYKSLLGYSFWS